jgi:thymidylate synthase (FAD)
MMKTITKTFDTTPIDYLEDGLSSVQLVNITGSDSSVVAAARVSFSGDNVDSWAENSEDMKNRDKKLIKYLLENSHGSPAEHNQITFRVNAPLAISTQMLRHRVGTSFNFESRRYTEVEDAEASFYIPIEFRVQHENNRQASVEAEEGSAAFDGFEGSKTDWNTTLRKAMKDANDKAYKVYKLLLEEGVAKEQARFVLPVGQYSAFYFTVNIRSLFHFLNLRDHEGAQWEIQMLAKAMAKMVEPHFPVTFDAWNSTRIHA